MLARPVCVAVAESSVFLSHCVWTAFLRVAVYLSSGAARLPVVCGAARLAAAGRGLSTRRLERPVYL